MGDDVELGNEGGNNTKKECIKDELLYWVDYPVGPSEMLLGRLWHFSPIPISHFCLRVVLKVIHSTQFWTMLRRSKETPTM